MNGKSGLFPSNFVKEIDSTEDTETSDVTEEPGTAQLILWRILWEDMSLQENTQ